MLQIKIQINTYTNIVELKLIKVCLFIYEMDLQSTCRELVISQSQEANLADYIYLKVAQISIPGALAARVYRRYLFLVISLVSGGHDGEVCKTKRKWAGNRPLLDF